MENNNIINNNEEVKPKRVYTEAQIRAIKTYHERHKNSEEFKQRQRVNSKKAYEKDKERIIQLFNYFMRFILYSKISKIFSCNSINGCLLC